MTGPARSRPAQSRYQVGGPPQLVKEQPATVREDEDTADPWELTVVTARPPATPRMTAKRKSVDFKTTPRGSEHTSTVRDSIAVRAHPHPPLGPKGQRGLSIAAQEGSAHAARRAP
ncbi:hypothetical protein Scel_18120 [Streptomyces cellostaticus]|nr:hypothetical protein Scel_18120 [Streptomyces cellostaticus]